MTTTDTLDRLKYASKNYRPQRDREISLIYTHLLTGKNRPEPMKMLPSNISFMHFFYFKIRSECGASAGLTIPHGD